MNQKQKKENIYEFELIEDNKKPKTWLKSMLTDERGDISSKRFIGLLSSLTLLACLVITIVTNGEYSPNDILVESVALLAFGTLGLTSIDKFGWRKNKNNNTEEEL